MSGDTHSRKVQAVKKVADALMAGHKIAAERMASALIEYMEAADAAAEDRMDARMDRMDTRLDRQDQTIREMREHMDTRLDRQDQTLRMVWKQVKGNGKLPIDDPLP